MTRARRRRPARRRALGLTAVMIAAGLLFATSALAAHGRSLRTDRADTAALLRTEQAKADAARARVAELTAELNRLTTAQGAVDATVAAGRRAVDAAAGPAGMAPVTGDSVVVTLDDAPPGRGREGLRPDELVVHQQDVQAVVNALWAGGAQGITLMGHRVIATTAVRCVGNTVLLADRLYSPPYEIVAVGDPARLQRALDSAPDVALYREYSRQVGLVWSSGPGGRRTLPGYTGSVQLRYATPATG